MDVQARKQFFGAALELGVVHEAEAVLGFTGDPHVLSHRHVRHKVEFLVDHGDALAQGIDGRFEGDGLAFESDLAFVRRVDAGNDLHQRGLARAVLAHQSVHRAGAQREANVVQSNNTGKALKDPMNFQ